MTNRKSVKDVKQIIEQRKQDFNEEKKLESRKISHKPPVWSTTLYECEPWTVEIAEKK